MRKVLTVSLVLIALLTACNMPAETTPEGPYGFAGPEEMEVLEEPTNTPETEMAEPTSKPDLFSVEAPDPERVAYDFTANYCDAEWSTNASIRP